MPLGGGCSLVNWFCRGGIQKHKQPCLAWIFYECRTVVQHFLLAPCFICLENWNVLNSCVDMELIPSSAAEAGEIPEACNPALGQFRARMTQLLPDSFLLRIFSRLSDADLNLNLWPHEDYFIQSDMASKTLTNTTIPHLRETDFWKKISLISHSDAHLTNPLLWRV